MKLKIMLAGVILVSSLPVCAGAISYNHVQIDIGKLSGDVEGESYDAKSASIGVSAELGSTFYAQFGLGQVKVDGEGTARTLGLGVGAHFPIAKTVDVYAELGFARADIAAQYSRYSYKENDTGSTSGLGVKVGLPASLELDVGVSRIDVFESAENTKHASLFYVGSARVGVGITYTSTDDIDGVAVGFRAVY